MPDTPNQVGSGNVASEYRVPRFAELDAQIQIHESIPPHKPTERKPERRRTRSPLPREVRKEITRCAQQLRQYRKLFMDDPKLRERAARVLRSLLPPKRKRGRPGMRSVTRATLLLKRLQREHPQEDRRQIWQRVYPQAIPDYGSLTREQQRGQENVLREQVRSRRHQQRKRSLTYK